MLDYFEVCMGWNEPGEAQGAESPASDTEVALWGPDLPADLAAAAV
jgi:hypothetical protein